jgi:hypothetical protein
MDGIDVLYRILRAHEIGKGSFQSINDGELGLLLGVRACLDIICNKTVSQFFLLPNGNLLSSFRKTIKKTVGRKEYCFETWKMFFVPEK